MDIMLRNGQELNIKWTFSISLIFHIFILLIFLSYSFFTRTSPNSLNILYKPFTAVQVNLVDISPLGSAGEAVRSKKQEARSQMEEVKSKKQEVNKHSSVNTRKNEDVVKKTGIIPPLEIKKQRIEVAAQGSEERSSPAAVQNVLPTTGNAGNQEAKLTTPWSSGITGGIAGGVAGAGGPAVDAPDFKYDYYLGLIRNKVDNRWNQPVTYAYVKKAVVEFTIQRNGKVDNLRISESSGDTYFDQTALRAVSVSAPFPPLPKGYKENSLRVRYKFIFEKRGNG